MNVILMNVILMNVILMNVILMNHVSLDSYEWHIDRKKPSPRGGFLFTKYEWQIDRKEPPPPGVFPIYYVPSSRTVVKRTPLEVPGTNSSRGVLLLTVLDERTNVNRYSYEYLSHSYECDISLIRMNVSLIHMNLSHS